MPKRKISFNYLFLKVGDLEQPIEGALNKVLNYIISKDKVNRKQDVNNDKFAFLDSFDYDTTSQIRQVNIIQCNYFLKVPSTAIVLPSLIKIQQKQEKILKQ